MTASEVPQTVVNLQEEMNRTTEPMTFQVSANEVSSGTEKKILKLAGVIAFSRAQGVATDTVVSCTW